MLNYVKFIKEIISNMRKLNDYRTMNLSQNYIAIIQKRPSKKLKDPTSFIIPCTLRKD